MAPDLGMKSGWGAAGVYHPLVRAATYPVRLAVHVRGSPADFVPRLRAIATEVEVTLQVTDLMPMRDVVNDEVSFYELWVKLTTVVSVIVLVMSMVAIYAVMSYAVSRRTREIGVRVALGASPRRILGAVFAHPMKQIGFGMLGGAGLVTLMLGEASDVRVAFVAGVVGIVAVAMAVACMLACIVPTRRALGVQPMDALRSD